MQYASLVVVGGEVWVPGGPSATAVAVEETQVEVERRIHLFADTSRSQWLIGRGWYYSAFPGGKCTCASLKAGMIVFEHARARPEP
ncbi:MAG: hypothetical protein E6I95_08975 [Chloroflexi bacterium]|nr:MAG: hypothetical protein E6I95_08975 [Chloroflexota bacterium]